jgi:GNAT superfamily N-acetyltransferase
MKWRSRRLAPEHQTADFDCGNEALDRWLREQALRAEEAAIAATTVWTPPAEDRVVGYFSVAPTQLRRSELPRGSTGGYSTVPGYLLGRLALHRELQGQGLGTQLLLDALEVIVAAAEHGAGRIIVVDAIDEHAAAFYELHGFVRVHGAMRLVMKVATARNELAH